MVNVETGVRRKRSFVVSCSASMLLAFDAVLTRGTPMSRLATAVLVLFGMIATGCATSRHAAPRATGPAYVAPEGKEIVRLVGQHQTVIVTSGPDGPLYTARTADGRTLVANASLAELRTQHPEIYRSIEPAMAVDASLEGSRPPGKSMQPKSTSSGSVGVTRDRLMLDSAR
jgi:hypothetical protein